METFNYKEFLQENRNSLIAMVKEEMRFDLIDKEKALALINAT